MYEQIRLIIVQKIYEKITSSNKDIKFKKHPYIRYIKKIFYAYFEREIDLEKILKKHLDNTKIKFNNIDLLLKIILKASIYELCYVKKTPSKVVIDEYLNVTARFYDTNQKKLVNAILDSVYKSQ